MTLPKQSAVATWLGRMRGAMAGNGGLGARLFRGSVLAASVSAVGVVLSFATQLILARSLGADDYGVYAVVLSWLNVLQIFATLGLENAAVRFGGAYSGTGAWGTIRGYARFGVLVVLGTSAAFILIGAIVLAVRPALAGGMYYPILTLALLLPCYAALLIQSFVLQGIGDVVAAQAPTAIGRPLIFIVLVGSLSLVTGRHLPTTEVLLLNFVAAACMLGLSSRLIARRASFAPPASTQAERATWLRVSLALLTMSIFQMGASQQLGTFVVGLLRAPRDAGIYSAANQLSLPLMLGVQAVHFVAAPLMADLHARSERAELQRVITLSFLGSAAFALPAFLAMVFFGKWALALYGSAFVEGYPILLVLSATVLIIAMGGGIGSWLLSVTGHEKTGIRIVAIAAASNLVLSVLLVKQLGMLGAAIAAGIAVALRFLMVAVYVKQNMGLNLVPVRQAVDLGMSLAGKWGRRN